MSSTASAGTTFKLSAGVPATFDSTGYNALSYTTVGEVLSYGEIGVQWSIDSTRPVAIKGEKKIKTSRAPGQITISLALDTDDAGQILMKTARDSTALYAFLITTPEGDKYYCQGLVTAFKATVGDQSAKKTASATIEVSTSATDVDWVEVLA